MRHDVYDNHPVRVSLLLCLLFALGGCSTIANQQVYWTDPQGDEFEGDMQLEIRHFRICNIYGGTVANLSMIGTAFSEPSKDHTGQAIVGTLDFPLSLGADTVVLPLTIYQQATSPSRERDEGVSR